MISKNQFKYIRSLHQKKFRDHHQQFILEGIRSLSSAMDSVQSLQASVSNLNVLTKKFDPVDKGAFTETRFIVEADSEEKMKSVFSVLSTSSHNVALRKAIVRTDTESNDSKSVFYISVYVSK